METVVAPVVAEPTTPIKPSEALRLGRLIYPVRLTDGRATVPQEHAACAIGAIWYGDGPLNDFGRCVPCPTDSCSWFDTPRDASVLVIHLNDDHMWSDDQIVAWLESLDL